MNRGIRVLQTLALPLGYVAILGIRSKRTLLLTPFCGAGDGARTRYLHLGKVALYQMSYARRTLVIIAGVSRFVKGEFSF